MGDEHLSTIPETKLDKLVKSSVEDLVSIPSESKGISKDICDVPFCDNDHFDAEFGLIDSLLSRDISITSPKIDFLPEEFAGELDLIDPILPIEALNLTPSIPFVLKYPSSSPIPIVDSTDISKITRKPSKTGKHGHENGRVNKSRKPKPEKVKSSVNSSQSWSTEVNYKRQNP
ncbi:hypothetical protein Tco_0867176 [Tanacetum coccineum]